MVGYTLRIGSRRIPLTPALLIYIVTWIMSIIGLYVIWPIIGIRYEGLQEYYVELSKITRIWGYSVGSVLVLTAAFLLLRGTITASVKSLYLKMTKLEYFLCLLFIGNIGWAILGLLIGSPISYILGDTFKGMLLPVIYWIVKRSRADLDDVIFLTKVILWGETLLLFVLVPTGHIPFSYGGRTFLTTIFFTLLFEEKNVTKRILFGLLLIFGIFTLLTTAAVRGIIIIFLAIIILNYFIRLRDIKFSVVIFAFLLPTFLLYAVNELLDLKLGEHIEWAGRRLEGSVTRERRFFGLDESLAQRVGETIDVARTFSESSPIFLFIGFGNGAHLVNNLITPAEYHTYKTNKKHHIYVTIVAVLYRYGLLGIILYGGIVWYVISVLRRLRKYRTLLSPHREFVYLKVLSLYQISVILMSFVTYWYIGNIIVAFTLALMEFFRREMESKIKLVTT